MQPIGWTGVDINIININKVKVQSSVCSFEDKYLKSSISTGMFFTIKWYASRSGRLPLMASLNATTPWRNERQRSETFWVCVSACQSWNKLYHRCSVTLFQTSPEVFWVQFACSPHAGVCFLRVRHLPFQKHACFPDCWYWMHDVWQERVWRCRTDCL